MRPGRSTIVATLKQNFIETGHGFINIVNRLNGTKVMVGSHSAHMVDPDLTVESVEWLILTQDHIKSIGTT